MNNEREGLPSASFIPRAKLCPGAWLRCKDAPELESEYAEQGDRIHVWLANGFLKNEQPQLTDDERKIADACVRQGLQLLSTVGSPYEMIVETRLWYYTESLEKKYSGKADLIVINRQTKSATIIDWKTLTGMVPDSPSNYQLRTLAVLLKSKYPWLKTIRVAIVQPLVANEPVVTEYGEEELRIAEIEINKIVLDINHPNQPVNPGRDQCKYCKAKTGCQEYSDWVSGAIEKSNRPQAVGMLTVNQITRILEVKEEVMNWFDSVKAEAEARLTKDPTSLPGWKMGGSRKSAVVDKVDAAYEALKGTMPTELFLAACKVAFPELRKGFARHHKIDEKEAELLLLNALGSNVEIRTSRPFLQRAKP